MSISSKDVKLAYCENQEINTSNRDQRAVMKTIEDKQQSQYIKEVKLRQLDMKTCMHSEQHCLMDWW